MDVESRPLIVASNRGPVTFTREPNGNFTSKKGSGGVVTAVTGIAHDTEPIWVACPMTLGDRRRAEQARESGEEFIIPEGLEPAFRLRFVLPDSATYHKYYNKISNPLLWFLQHYLWDTPTSPDITADTYDAWTNGYVVVNQLFAEEILSAAAALDEEPIIMLQDYHLYLTPGFIRERRPNAIVQQFIQGRAEGPITDALARDGGAA